MFCQSLTPLSVKICIIGVTVELSGSCALDVKGADPVLSRGQETFAAYQDGKLSMSVRKSFDILQS